MSKIIGLEVQNVKGIKAVRIDPKNGNIVPITGKNGAGKSSILDSIVYGLGGTREQCGQPIRRGETDARVEIDLGDIKVVRRWDAKGTRLEVFSAEGAKFPSPQTMLDKLVGELTFDPFAFARMDAKEQAAILRRVAKIDTSQLDMLRQATFEKRTDTNRRAKDIEGWLSLNNKPEGPDDEVSIAELTTKLNHAQSEKLLADRIDARIQDIEADIAELEAKLSEARKSLAHLRGRRDDAPKVPDILGLTQLIGDAESRNAIARARRAHSEKSAALAAEREQSEAMTAELGRIDAEKKHLMEAAELPIGGLSLDADGVSMNGVPLDQCSSAERLRVSVAMGIALNPKLRVMLIRDGSLLDESGMAAIAEMADTNDMQVWIERVASDKAVGWIIEDGELAVQELAGAAQ